MSSTELDTRERLLKETWHLMEKRRGQGVRLEDVAKNAGVSRQALYLHFGSRSELLIATARYLDETLGLEKRLEQTLNATSAVASLEAYVEFWANYIPDIYGLAKALMTVRETDEAAAAAWNDRMQAVYGGCLNIVQCLEKENMLDPTWTVEEAADFFWASLAIENWEHLTVERGWSKKQYITRLQRVLKQAFLRAP